MDIFWFVDCSDSLQLGYQLFKETENDSFSWERYTVTEIYHVGCRGGYDVCADSNVVVAYIRPRFWHEFLRKICYQCWRCTRKLCRCQPDDGFLVDMLCGSFIFGIDGIL